MPTPFIFVGLLAFTALCAVGADSARSDPQQLSAQEPAALSQVDQSAATAAALAAAALIVMESRASYGGSCGCPDDRDRAGRKCGARSAYARAGGRSLFCYAEDVPAALVAKRMAQR